MKAKPSSSLVTSVKQLSTILFFLFLIRCSSDDTLDETGNDVHDEDTIENDSYFLVIDQDSRGIYLIDHDGTELFDWQMDRALGNDANLLDDGSLVVALKADNTQITFGGYGGVFRKINADQSVDWEVTYASGDDYIAHHDVEYLSNGNIIFPAWEKVNATEAVVMGFSGSRDIYPEAIVEMNPLTQEIVWEWHVTDHLIQDNDASKENYGVVADNPNKVDLNYNSTHDGGNLMHINGLTLDETNDLLYLTVNFYSEVWVLDHSTSTEEAASSSGGNYGVGGDLVYRFGNPDAYDNMGEITLNRVHYPNLLENGNMLVYGNNVYGNQSAIIEYQLNPPYQLEAGQDNEPSVVWSFTDPNLYSSGLGSAVRTANGTTLIAEGRDGTLWEVTDGGEVIWRNTDYQTIWRAYSFPENDPAIQALGL